MGVKASKNALLLTIHDHFHRVEPKKVNDGNLLIVHNFSLQRMA